VSPFCGPPAALTVLTPLVGDHLLDVGVVGEDGGVRCHKRRVPRSGASELWHAALNTGVHALSTAVASDWATRLLLRGKRSKNTLTLETSTAAQSDFRLGLTTFKGP
jgi:hypothetical protein